MKVREAIEKMGFYDPPLGARSDSDMLMLDFNESTIPPSPEIIAELVRYLKDSDVQRYPLYGPLTEKLARYAGVAPDELILCNGGDQALDVVLRSLLEQDDEMVFARPGFAMIPHFAETFGARIIFTEYGEDMNFPFEETLRAVGPRTRLITIINPNNPTGTRVPEEQIRAILEAHPRVPVLVDEAYHEFSGETVVPLIGKHDNLVVIRTLSKAFAMAGMRLGYALSNRKFIRELHKVRGPFDVNVLAVKAAEASLDRPEGSRAYVEEVMTRAKPMVERFFDEHGVTYFKGAANFMLVRPGNRAEACRFLARHKILVRPQNTPIEDTFRMSVGTVADMKRFMQVYAQYLEGTKQE